MRCLYCGRLATDRHHWPETVGMGRNRKLHPELPTVPLCRVCHTECHAGNEAVTIRLIERAPAYWFNEGVWAEARPYYERFVSRREYRGLTCLKTL